MQYQLNLKNIKAKNIYPLDDNFRGQNQAGEEIAFTNYYMAIDGKPFYGIGGEFHYSRMADRRWEDEIIKMKMAGINVITSYIFWIHHEEEEGVFDFSGRLDLKKFVGLCAKHGLYVIIRVGPFDHGEVRNGGLPDWLYGKPFEARALNDGFLALTRRLYTNIARQVEGLFYQDNGPIIGVQIDNEYMHSSAPWELTAGMAEEWVFGGDEGDQYMLTLKALAAECGLTPVFYTCTAWGGAITPDSMLPLWGGYAFRPWLFYSYQGEHPATEEYVYQDFHNDQVTSDYDFKPRYRPEERPYACCEMGGGMTCCYYYRFQYPYKSVDAMANIKMASGCNFLGYYMFQGGSNPVGKTGIFLNEGQVPKISYDYQAALGEFGQVRESYRRLKSIHYFARSFGGRLCAMATVMPKGASQIAAADTETLRYSVRTDGTSGFLFINNFQDHAAMPDRHDEEITLRLEGEDLTYRLGIAADENAILPFHLQLDGIDLIKATAQPLTRIAPKGEITYVFFTPEGMQAEFVFEKGIRINGAQTYTYHCRAAAADCFTVEKEQTVFRVLVISRAMADQMFILSDERLVFTGGALLEDENGLRLETTEAVNRLRTYPADIWANRPTVKRQDGGRELLGEYIAAGPVKRVEASVTPVAAHRYTVMVPPEVMAGCKDVRLQIEYHGNIGQAFIAGRLINDNFANGAVWEIGLKDFAADLAKEPLTVYITPLKEGAKVNVESAMAARREEVKKEIGELTGLRLQPVYELVI